MSRRATYQPELPVLQASLSLSYEYTIRSRTRRQVWDLWGSYEAFEIASGLNGLSPSTLNSLRSLLPSPRYLATPLKVNSQV